MKMFGILQLVKEQQIQIGDGDNTHKQEIPLTWAEGMIGVIPFFESRATAEAYAGDKYQVMEYETK